MLVDQENLDLIKNEKKHRQQQNYDQVITIKLRIEYNNLRKHFFQDVEAKYSKFVDLKKLEKVILIHVFEKKLGYYDFFEEFQLKETYSMKQKHGNRDY